MSLSGAGIAPWHRLNFFPLPHGHGLFRLRPACPGVGDSTTQIMEDRGRGRKRDRRFPLSTPDESTLGPAYEATV